MKNSTIVLFGIWIALAILDIVDLFVNVPLVFGVIFAILNSVIIIGNIPMVVEVFKTRKLEKKLKKEDNGVQLQ